MYKIRSKAILIIRPFFIVLTILVVGCKEKGIREIPKDNTEHYSDAFDEKSSQNNPPLIYHQNTVFQQKHSNLNGMVSEFVRKIYQDKNGTFWFGTNGDGIIRYNNKSLEEFNISEDFNGSAGAVRGIIEDKMGNIWFGTSSGLIKYDGKKFKIFSKEEGLPGKEIWGLTIDEEGLIWVGTTQGIYQFDGKNFTNFTLPKSSIKDSKPMLSDKLVFKFMEDKNGTMWFVTDGNGIYKYKNNNFTQLTRSNGLTDNNVADVFEDSKGNLWIGTFNGGVSKYDGNTFTNFTKNGVIDGPETYNFCEDHKGNIWFSAENFGVYRYDGEKFTQFTTKEGLATNTIQNIFEDNKGQIWFSTWEGISLYDGKEIMNISDKEPWTK
ncbi:two-component regulator propeller domain-containing protein [Zunongwangia sp. H14]|uniref:ligand-binding sensor domain-containing protein n=1 Tax=Zunongwangia sp. H14 TaxID=3240792 RepID=UPI00356B103B